MLAMDDRRLHSAIARRLVLLLVLLLVACGTAAPATTPQPTSEAAAPLPSRVLEMDAEERQRTVIWDMYSGPVSNPSQWNPLSRDARLDKGFHQTMIEPLFILNYETGVIEPWLGERMTANDSHDVWTLELREGITWSDGEAFTAEDVVFTTNLVLENPELELDFFAGFTDWVERAEVVDAHTVAFTLSDSNPRFQLDFFSVKVWGSFPVLPEHIWHDKDPATFTNYDPERGWPVFTGPYTLADFDVTSFVYERNDDWWGAQTGFRPLPQPERMIWVETHLSASPEGLQAASQLDSIGNLPLATFQQLRDQNSHIAAWFDGLPYAWMDPCSRLLSLNHTVEPWGDARMRWALNFALERQQIVDQAYDSTTLASRHFFPAYPPLDRYVQLLEDADIYAEHPLNLHAPERARELIEAAGWQTNAAGIYQRNGEPLTLTIFAHAASSTMQEVARVLAEQFRAVGIDATVEVLRDVDWTTNKREGTFEAMIDWDACGSINEPWASLDRYHERWVRPVGEPTPNYNNQIRWENAEYSALVDEMAALPLGDPRIDDLFVEAMRIWFAELPFIPLVQEKQLVPFNTTYWSNWPTERNNYVHPPNWWQSTHLILHNLEPTNSIGVEN